MKSATTQETEAAATSGESSASAAAAAAAYMRQFENIIAPGKEASMTREFKPQVAYEFEHYSNPQKLKNDVLRSDKMRKVLEHYSRETQQPIRKLEQQARAIIDEIGLDRNMAIIRWCGIAITAIGKRICDGIYVNSESMANVRKEMGHCPVLYLPSHRSYMDFILMSYICYYYDIEIPGIAAGMGKSSCNSNCVAKHYLLPYPLQTFTRCLAWAPCCAKLAPFLCDVPFPTTNSTGTSFGNICTLWWPVIT